jgi:hypothetical protein
MVRFFFAAFAAFLTFRRAARLCFLDAMLSFPVLMFRRFEISRLDPASDGQHSGDQRHDQTASS